MLILGVLQSLLRLVSLLWILVGNSISLSSQFRRLRTFQTSNQLSLIRLIIDFKTYINLKFNKFWKFVVQCSPFKCLTVFPQKIYQTWISLHFTKLRESSFSANGDQFDCRIERNFNFTTPWQIQSKFRHDLFLSRVLLSPNALFLDALIQTSITLD